MEKIDDILLIKVYTLNEMKRGEKGMESWTAVEENDP